MNKTRLRDPTDSISDTRDGYCCDPVLEGVYACLVGTSCGGVSIRLVRLSAVTFGVEYNVSQQVVSFVACCYKDHWSLLFGTVFAGDPFRPFHSNTIRQSARAK